MEYMNKLFISNSPEDILRFYDYFDETKDLVEWMIKRPKGNFNVYEVDSESDVAVVIPTKSVTSMLAKNCRNIFAGSIILFIESGESNPYFNYAHNCNEGIKRALKYDAKWIIVSNDDVIKVDDFNVLTSQLKSLDRTKVDMIYTNPALYHSIPVCLSTSKFSRKLLFSTSKNRRYQIKLEKKFKINYFSSRDNFLWNLFFKCNYKHISIADFAIFNSNYLKDLGGTLFDETYINGGEDIDFSLNFHMRGEQFRFVDYTIRENMGTSLGTGPIRYLRDIINYAYFNYKIYNESIKIPIYRDSKK